MSESIESGISREFIDRETQRIFDSIADGFLVLDGAWRIVYVNPEAARINRKPASEFLGRTQWEEWPATVGSEVEKQYRKALREQVAVHFEHRYVAPGRDAWLDIHAYPFRSGLALIYRDITSRKQTEEALRESEERYRTTFDNAAVGIAHVDLEGRWIRFNDAVCAITGYSREELNARNFGEITHPDDLDADWSLARRVASGEIPTYTLEKRYIRKNGSIVWVSLTVSMLRDSSGKPKHYISVIENIGERKRAEAALLEREERLNAVLESIADAFLALDRDWNFTYVNTAWERITGLSREDVLGKNHWDAMAGVRGTVVETEFRRAARERAPVEFEILWKQRWFASRVYPSRDGGITCYARDITLRKATEEALQESEERYRSLVLATSAFVWTSDARGEFRSPQPSWQAYTGQTWEEYRGANWIAAVHPDDRARVAEVWRRAVETTSTYEIDWRAWHAPSGAWRHCSTRGVPVIGQDGTVREWIGAVTDVHERKLLEAKLQHEDKVESLGVLAGGVAHDFNNLLVGIIGNASLAMDDAGPGARRVLEEVVKASERAAHLTRQMLAYAGKGQFVFEPIDMSREVRDVAALVRSSLGPAAQLELQLADDLPAVWADGGQIQQIVMNLLINAGEALHEKRGRIRVSTSVESSPERRVVLTVQDDGKGMTPEVKARIFDPFFSTKFTGRGLGLAAVMGIVRAHKGSIDVESAPGRGTTFRVYLPASGVTEPAEVEQFTVAPDRAPASVLVIDDEDVVLMVAKTALTRAGIRVLFASSGREGIEIFRSRAAEIDTVIVDATMPDLGGREVLREIRRLRPGMPVIVSSGHTLSEVRRYFGKDEPSAFLPKPYKPVELVSAVSAYNARNGR